MESSSSSKCLICLSSAATGNYLTLETPSDLCPTLAKQLDPIFLLRNVLELSTTHLENYLRTMGNPENWFGLCRDCSQIVTNVKDKYLEVQRATRNYDEVRLMILQKIKSTDNALPPGDDQCGTDGVVRECRDLVCKNKLPRIILKSPPEARFAKGDQETRQMTRRSRRKKPADANAKVELEAEVIVGGSILRNRRAVGPPTPIMPPIIKAEREETVADAEVNTDIEMELGSVGEDYDDGDDGTISPEADSARPHDPDGNLTPLRIPDWLPPPPSKRSEKDPDWTPDTTNTTHARELTPRLIQKRSKSQAKLTKHAKRPNSTKRSKPHSTATHLDRDPSPELELPEPPDSPSPSKRSRKDLDWRPDTVFFRKVASRPILKRSKYATRSKPNDDNGESSNSEDPDDNNRSASESTGHLYSCDSCEAWSNRSLTQFLNHIDLVHRASYRCLECPRFFKFYSCEKINHHFKRTLKKHITREYHYVKFTRDNDPRVERVTSSLPSIPFWCPKCSEMFPDESQRDLHLDTCLQEEKLPRPFQCSDESCERSFFSQDELKLHQVKDHPESLGLFRCLELDCLEYFPTPLALQRHRSHVHQKGFSCPEPECPEELKSSNDLRIHRIKVHGYKPLQTEFQCKVCGINQPDADRLERHMSLSHPNLTCDLCKISFPSTLSLKSHLFDEHQIGSKVTIFRCDFASCGKEFGSKHSLKEHKARHQKKPSEKQSHPCDLCHKILRSEKGLREHKIIVHKMDGANFQFWECSNSNCSRRFRNWDDYTKHEQSCARPKVNHQCDLCNTEFLTKDDLRTHLRFKHQIETAEDEEENSGGNETDAVVTQSYPNQCNQCGKFFPDAKKLYSHEKYIHSDSRLTCQFCGSQFHMHMQMSLDYHLARRHGVDTDNFHCSNCDLWFNTRNKKAKHQCGQPVTKEARKKMHICKICGREFNMRQRLRMHVGRVHETSLRHFCQICGISMNTKMSLRKHLAGQHGVGDWKCEVEGCDKAFISKEEMEDHHRYKHLGEERPKPYVCDFCGKRFYRNGALYNHRRIAHQIGKLFPCGVCGDALPTPLYLERHLKAKHGIGEEGHKNEHNASGIS